MTTTTAKLTFSALLLGAIFVYQDRKENSDKITVEGEIVLEEQIVRIFPNYPVHAYYVKSGSQIYKAIFEPEKDLYDVGNKVKFTLGSEVQQTYSEGLYGKRILEHSLLNL
ncbi:MAG: hypothetical protein KKA62_05940 [Nanoarchaeota archaeon]|nr:hypothetical protein [Nanoarchaeota archaeon]MBU1643645.1 hypothetical protein [Nanoarchaeota archaeon]MBU1977465.1 hypothetical protein [Nanoarchaeota archaeon]